MPEEEEEEEEAAPVKFVIQGFSHLSQGLESGDSAAPRKSLEGDLKTYEVNAKKYTRGIMKQKQKELKEGETLVNLQVPDPILFWKNQVNISVFFTRLN